jgi:hypothetical protein
VPTKQQRSATFFYTGKGEIQDVVNICDDFSNKAIATILCYFVKKEHKIETK